MQAFLFRSAHDRIADRLSALAPNLDVVVLEPDGALTSKGEPVAPDTLKPEVWWLSLEAFGAQRKEYFGRLRDSADAKWVQTVFAGVEHPSFKPLARDGLLVTNSSAQAPAIAEYVTIHAMSLLHPIAEQAKRQAAHDWSPVDFREVGQSRWLIVGFGNIGREIAVRAKAFGAEVEVVRRSPGGEANVDAVCTQADLPSRLPQADVVVLACALNDQTRDLADAAFFAAMKPGSILINIGRGGLLVEDDLRAALEAGKPAHAVLDVFRTEPLPAESWLWSHPQVRITPHASNRGALTGARGDALFLENLRRYLAGEPLLNPVNPADIGVG